MWQLLNPALFKSIKKENPQQADWLMLSDRLTRALRSALGGAYQFQLLNQDWRDLNPDESALLKQEGKAWVRSITHQSGHKVLVEGFSIIPQKTFEVLSSKLESLEARPIGDTLLYDNPKMTRSAFYFQKVGNFWQRASLFFYTPGDEESSERYPLMVMERFVSPESLPAYIPVFSSSLGSDVRRSEGERRRSNSSFESGVRRSNSSPEGGGRRSNSSPEGGGRRSNSSPLEGEGRVGGGSKAFLKLMRLHKPLPILLCLWPTLWGLWLASGGFPGFKLLIIFMLGVFLMRSAGCIFNDIFDRDFDKYVARTRDRPLATGEISVMSALSLALVLCLLAFGVVCLTNILTIKLSFVALGLAVLYPLMKRWIKFPQVFLGFAFNFGLIMSFSAVQNHIPLIAWLWYFSAVLWTVMYDTYYALADKQDDEKIGIGSTAILFGKYIHVWLRGFQLVVFILWGVFLFDQVFAQGLSMMLKLVVIFLLLLLSFYRQNQFAKEKHYLQAFLDNHWVGFLIFMGIFILFYR